jgi:hypothetical protein
MRWAQSFTFGGIVTSILTAMARPPCPLITAATTVGGVANRCPSPATISAPSTAKARQDGTSRIPVPHPPAGHNGNPVFQLQGFTPFGVKPLSETP